MIMDGPKRALLILQSIAAGLVLLSGSADAIGVIGGRALTITLLIIGAAQLALSTYTHGLASGVAQGVESTMVEQARRAYPSAPELDGQAGSARRPGADDDTAVIPGIPAQ